MGLIYFYWDFNIHFWRLTVSI